MCVFPKGRHTRTTKVEIPFQTNLDYLPHFFFHSFSLIFTQWLMECKPHPPHPPPLTLWGVILLCVFLQSDMDYLIPLVEDYLTLFKAFLILVNTVFLPQRKDIFNVYPLLHVNGNVQSFEQSQHARRLHVFMYSVHICM